MRKSLIISLTGLLSQGLYAQTERFLLEDSVVSASGFEQEIKEAPASISVIPQEEILSRPIRDLGDIVQEVPGVSTTVSKTGGTTIQMRGMASKYTLILVDGKRVNMDSGFDSNGFDSTSGFIPPTSMIERVEVIRGPASTLYGSDAMGGVINIITKKNPNKFGGTIAFETRLQEHHETWGNVYGVNSNVFAPINAKTSFNFRGKVNYGEGNAFYQKDIPGYTPTGNNPYTSHSPTGYRNIGTGGRVNYIYNLENSFYVDFDYGFQRLGSLNTSSRSVTAVRDYHRYNTVLNHDGNYTWGSINNYIQYVNTTKIPHKNVNIGADAGEPNRDALVENQNLILSSSLRKNFDFGQKGALILSGGPYFKNEKLFNRSNRFDKDSNQFALFGEGEYFFNEYVSTTAGLRVNYDETYKEFFNPRFYVNTYPTEWLSLKAGVASGLKLPELNTRYNGLYDIDRNNVAKYGNESLKAEESWNYELSTIVESPFATWTLTGFYTDFKNAISTQNYGQGQMLPSGYGSCSYASCDIFENVDKAVVSGVEFSMKTQALLTHLIPNGIYADFNYALTETQRKSGVRKGSDLNDVPRHNLSTKLSYKASKWDTYIRYVGKLKTPTSNSHSANAGTGEYFKDMHTMDLGMNYRIKGGWTLGAVINNLLDKNFVDYVTYMDGTRMRYTNNYQRMIPGRNLWLTLRAEF
ncbi:TonB-dependent receptor domain-containing protein [Helicobacter turcicus]|uniref:TonB-dependent receptor n=1 Tax=Helicobacter turcicus TaxID=2867412 RepID=A0ABS7JPH2_9HELI|nr:TonB-dependent receptor [Helicobacter turcicus]MBX7491313.1 TonB-dependent receptor [Helicobacter turcicus]MBX7546200.1 TonB-dependent receptor [Helicobacter turcicus]